MNIVCSLWDMMRNYYFNDPYDNNGVIGYPKEIVERRHAAQHSMALGVTEEKY